MISRRTFLQGLGGGLIFLAPPLCAGRARAATDGDLVEARYYEKMDHRKIKCTLCPRSCVIDDLERGYCGVRENRGGTYYTLVYGRLSSLHIDPIEKKPLFHFLPSSTALSVATAGCNVFCKFCQNWELSQSRPEQIDSRPFAPRELADMARQRHVPVIAFTYNEPIVFSEYVYDIAAAARRQGVRSVMISNGYIQKKPLLDLCQVLDGIKIDLKAFSERFYRELVSGELRPVLDTLVLLRGQKIWFEIVYLVIPGENDDPDELTRLCKWIHDELGTEVPIHFTRFYPQYRMTDLPPTPVTTLQRARTIARSAGLQYVYTGNLPGDPGENTRCPGCDRLLIRRLGYTIAENNLEKGCCPGCQRVIPGVWT